MFAHMIDVKTSKVEIRGYLCPTPGLPMERQRMMARDANCLHTYEHRPFDGAEFSQLDRWMQSLRVGDTAWLPSVLCLVYPAKDRPKAYRPLAGMCMALNHILASGAIIVDARAGITSQDPERWAKHVLASGQKVSAGTRTTAQRRMSMKEATAYIMPGVQTRWKTPQMAAKLALQKAIWTGTGTIKEARALLDDELRRCSTRTLDSLLGVRRPHDKRAGGRPPRHAREAAPRTRYVYFIRRGRMREVKIGSAYDVEGRLRQLRTSTSDDLRLIGVLAGDDTTECTIQKRFHAYWISREWFRLNGELAEFIKQIPKTE